MSEANAMDAVLSRNMISLRTILESNGTKDALTNLASELAEYNRLKRIELGIESDKRKMR